jgi:predicted tellurium resistance membrane protein TerC/nucleotide-binding universal stress UspA family protein
VDWIYSPEIWASLLTLTALEIVLGIDNIVMIAVIANALPPEQRDRARVIGLALALITRLLLLLAISWIAGLIQPLFTLFGQEISGRDLIMLGGGFFLLWKAVHEMHGALEEAGRAEQPRIVGRFSAAIAQIVLLDIVFSFDSVITAVGMARDLWVMVTAVVVAVMVMLWASGPIMRFIHAHPTVKMLALAFVLLIGVALVAEGFEFHIPKAYLYVAMAFSVMVESLNVTVSRRRARIAAEAAATRAEAGVPAPDTALTVLIPVDGTPAANRAVRQVATLAKDAAARLDVHLVNVRPPLGSARAYASPAALRGFQQEEAEKAFAPARAILQEVGITPTSHVLVGSVGERVARLAHEIRAARIVMGTRGTDRFLLGPMETDVLGHTDVPVTLVK